MNRKSFEEKGEVLHKLVESLPREKGVAMFSVICDTTELPEQKLTVGAAGDMVDLSYSLVRAVERNPELLFMLATSFSWFIKDPEHRIVCESVLEASGFKLVSAHTPNPTPQAVNDKPLTTSR